MVYEFCRHSARIMNGIYMYSGKVVHGVCKDACMILYGFRMDNAWVVQGFFLDFTAAEMLFAACGGTVCHF